MRTAAGYSAHSSRDPCALRGAASHRREAAAACSSPLKSKYARRAAFARVAVYAGRRSWPRSLQGSGCGRSASTSRRCRTYRTRRILSASAARSLRARSINLAGARGCGSRSRRFPVSTVRTRRRHRSSMLHAEARRRSERGILQGPRDTPCSGPRVAWIP